MRPELLLVVRDGYFRPSTPGLPAQNTPLTEGASVRGPQLG